MKICGGGRVGPHFSCPSAGVLSSSVGAWQTWSMKRDAPSYHGYRFPPEIISHAA